MNLFPIPLMVLLGAGPADSKAPASISGVVVIAETNIPAAHAIVRLIRFPNENSPSTPNGKPLREDWAHAVKSDKQGKFVFDKVPPGNYRIDVNRTDHSVALLYDPIDDPGVPVSRRVRGQIVSGAFRARSLGAGHGTNLTAEIHCDPKGAIPAWLVNTFQKNWPRKTFEGIRKQATKADVTMPEAFKALLTPTVDF